MVEDSADDFADLLAECIEALERGETDAVDKACAQATHLAPRLRQRIGQLAASGLVAFPEPVPDRIGPYRVIGSLGQGGMGTVYRCAQDEPVRREVAVKLIRPGMGTREVVARFLQERQALALMEHPGIAKLHDAGMTDDGRPFLVMELVRGEPITVWGWRHSASLDDVLRVFAKVCRAVQHAHDRGVIHRDLKPSNILVVEQVGDFEPKVIDFGVAKAIAPSPETVLHTRVGQVLGTPEYMSPEQARSAGVDVDTRTDVYSLGVLLYELIAGRMPFASERLRAAGTAELERILTEEEPEPPSSVLALRRPRLAPELDWVVQRAMAKERGRRYPSPLAFAEDLERFLAGEPVVAGPPTTAYRLRKLIRRHRVSFAAAGLVLVALVVGLCVSLVFWWQARRAEAQEKSAHAETRVFYDLAREALSKLVTTGAHRLRGVPRAEPVRRAMIEDALGFFATLRRHRPTDPDLRLEVVRALGDGGALLRTLGRLDAAADLLQESVRSATALRAEHPEITAVLRIRSATQAALARTYEQLGRQAQAEAAARAAVSDFEAVRREASSEPADRETEAALRHNLVILQGGPPRQQLERLRGTTEQLRATLATAVHPAIVREQISRAKTVMAQQLVQLGDWESAAGLLDQAGTELAALAATPEGQALDTRMGQAFAALARARLLRLRRKASEAVAASARGLAIRRELAAEHPDLVPVQMQLADALHEAALDKSGADDVPAALALLREEVALRHRVRPQPADPQQEVLRVSSLINLGSHLFDVGRASWDEARRVFDRAVAEGELLWRSTSLADAGVAVAAALAGSATLHAQCGEGDAAAADFARAETVLGAVCAAEPGNGKAWYHRAYASFNDGLLRLKSGEAAAGEPLLARAAELVERAATAASPSPDAGALRALALRNRTAALVMLGRDRDAVANIRRLIAAHPRDARLLETACRLLNGLASMEDRGLPAPEMAMWRLDAARALAQRVALAKVPDQMLARRAVEMLRRALQEGAKPATPPDRDPSFAAVRGEVDFPR